MRLTLGCSLCAGVVLLAYGHQLRGPSEDLFKGDGSGAPAYPDTKYTIQLDTAQAKMSALKVKAKFAENTAVADAAEASTQHMKVEDIYMRTMQVAPELNAIKKYAAAQSASATEAAKDTGASFKRIEKQVKPLVDEAKVLAVQQVKAMLKKKYSDLSEWRHKVLNNPWEKGQVAAAKAAVPYFKYMGNFAGTMASYGIEAGSMKAAAQADAANAKALAAGVDAKTEAGDVISAEQDRTMAKAMETQSGQLAARAATLEANVQDMQKVVPQYAGAAQIASWNAEYAANPDGVPPPPVDPNFAFASPEKLQA